MLSAPGEKQLDKIQPELDKLAERHAAIESMLPQMTANFQFVLDEAKWGAAMKVAGVTTKEFQRIMSPVGLDIGARTPEETAISICAEIIAMRTGRKAPHLKVGSGPIHGES